jgi:hypothetical protein
MLPGQKPGSERAVGYDGDVVRCTVVAQFFAHLADGKVVIVLDDAEARAEGTELLQRDVAGPKLIYRQLFERVGCLQRGFVPLMKIEQINLLHAEASQTVSDVNSVIRRQNLRGDGDALWFPRGEPFAENSFRSAAAISCCRVEMPHTAFPCVIEQRKGRGLVDLTAESDAAEADAGSVCHRSLIPADLKTLTLTASPSAASRPSLSGSSSRDSGAVSRR